MPTCAETAYPRLKNQIREKELREIYTPTREELNLASQHTRKGLTQLGFLILLKTFQRLGYFVSPNNVPSAIVNHIAQETGLAYYLDVLGNYETSRTRWRHTLEKAIYRVINAYNKFSLPKFWGTGKRVSADGTKWDIYEQNLLAEYHIRYGGYGGIGYYHVSDTYIALFSHFISCGVWEAVYILDGLLKNTSEIQPNTIHADTQGQSTPVFALAYLLGI